MPRRQREPDYSAVWDALTAANRATIAGMEKTLRLLPGGWVDAPPIRQTAVLLAAANLTLRTPELSESDSFAAAFEALGIEDDSEGATRPSDSALRLLREWRNPRNKKPAPAKPDPFSVKA